MWSVVKVAILAVAFSVSAASSAAIHAAEKSAPQVNASSQNGFRPSEGEEVGTCQTRPAGYRGKEETSFARRAE